MCKVLYGEKKSTVIHMIVLKSSPWLVNATLPTPICKHCVCRVLCVYPFHFRMINDDEMKWNKIRNKMEKRSRTKQNNCNNFWCFIFRLADKFKSALYVCGWHTKVKELFPLDFIIYWSRSQRHIKSKCFILILLIDVSSIYQSIVWFLVWNSNYNCFVMNFVCWNKEAALKLIRT